VADVKQFVIVHRPTPTSILSKCTARVRNYLLMGVEECLIPSDQKLWFSASKTKFLIIEIGVCHLWHTWNDCKHARFQLCISNQIIINEKINFIYTAFILLRLSLFSYSCQPKVLMKSIANPNSPESIGTPISALECDLSCKRIRTTYTAGISLVNTWRNLLPSVGLVFWANDR